MPQKVASRLKGSWAGHGAFSSQPDKDHQIYQILLAQLGWELPQQPPPRLSAKGELLK
jgi:hypothetical protein